MAAPRTGWQWLCQTYPLFPLEGPEIGKMAFWGDCELTEGSGERQTLSLEPGMESSQLFVLYIERTRNRTRFRGVGIMTISLTNSNPWHLEMLRFIFVLSFLRACRQIWVIWLWCTSEVKFLGTLILIPLDNTTFILFIQDRQFFKNIYYLCLFKRTVAETNVH